MFGKLVVDCTRSPECSLSPEQLELLNLYCALSGALLDALDRKQKWVNRASEMAMAKIAHSIKTKFAALDGLWTEYSRAAPNNPSIEKLNSFLKPSVLTTSRYVSRIHELFGRDVKLEHTSFNLASFLQEKSREHSCEHREDHPGLTIRVVCAEDVQVQLDPLALGIVLGNMFENSRAMTDPGQVSYVLVTAAIIDDHLQILVVDNGPGIPHEYRDKIFDLLFSHRPDGRQSTGLGLSQVRQIMDAFRGAVAVLDAQHIPATFVGGQGLQEDALLQGAAFKLIFPHALRKDVEK
ncbi:MAG: sensor histidine kinase [Planctomycetota bacterium]